MLGREGGEPGRKRLRLLRRLVQRRSGGLDELHLTPQLARARPVDRAVDGDPVQPGRERTAAIEPVEGTDGRKKRLLCDVLSSRSVVNDEVRGAVGARP